jgi:hypothetical protein
MAHIDLEDTTVSRIRRKSASVQTYSLGVLDGLVANHAIAHEDDFENIDMQERFENYRRPMRHINRTLRGGFPVRLRLWDEGATV